MKARLATIIFAAFLACLASLAFKAGDHARARPGGSAPVAAPRNQTAATPLAQLVFTQDYFPGTRDAHGQFMGGTEAMWLAGHGGKLFAAIGYGQDQPGDNPKPGAQILRKDTAEGPWQVDHQFPAGCMRVEALVSIAFTTDRQGKALPRPVRLLLASPSELRGSQAAGSVYVRNDWGIIYDAAHPVPAGQRLTGCRDIEPSPFDGETGRVFYFCGYDGGAGPSHNTAWIYRGKLPEPTPLSKEEHDETE